jgi:hypothetical protein
MNDAHNNALHELVGWLARLRRRIHDQVHVREEKGGGRTSTVVRIDHRLPCDLEEFEDWHVKTARTFLPSEHFSSHVRAIVGNADVGRGRAIYCHSSSEQEIVAVLAYHIDESERIPVLITTLGFRIDIDNNPSLRLRTLAGSLVLKEHAHAIAHKIGRGGHLDIDLGDKKNLGIAKQLGFQPAPRIKGYQPGGIHLRQSA